MIRLRRVSHTLRNGREILSGVDLEIPGNRRVALLGRQSAGKSTVLALLAGNVAPHRGHIERGAKVSYVAGFQGGFRVTQTGRQNIIFAARAYGADPVEVFEFVREVSRFDTVLDLPLRQMSVLNRNNLSYILAYALPFDIYLFDNLIGPIYSEISDFSILCQELFDERMAKAGCIIATRNAYIAQKYCDCAIILRDRKLEFFDDLREGVNIYNNDLLDADAQAAESAARRNEDDPLNDDIDRNDDQDPEYLN